MRPAGRAWGSAFHYRPQSGTFADPIPFFWKGVYHIFYLQGEIGLVPWQHIVSTDLIHWRKLPAALISDGPGDGPDGGHMFTGSVTEHDGTFHIFYTGHNPNNAKCLEQIRHATSADLIRWKKDPVFALRPDGAHYSAKHGANWRDPYVFWNETERKWWMLVIATDPTDPAEPGRAVQGLLVSDDLTTWEQRPAISGGLGEECPDLFQIDGHWYLIGAGRYVSSPSPTEAFHSPVHNVIDYPGIYAGKRMFDGRRHVWVGWAWDGRESTDTAVAGEGVLTWGGYMCLPRELYAGADGELLCRPVPELIALLSRTVAEVPAGENSPLPCPDACLIECTVRLDGAEDVSLSVREQEDGSAYRITVRPTRNEIALSTPKSEWVRSGCRIDATKPLSLRVFLDGSMLECFVNDAYAITRRIYDLEAGEIRVASATGVPSVELLRIKGLPR